MCTDCISSLGEKTETDCYSPFVLAINDALEKLQDLNIQGLKHVPEVAGPSIFLVNHPNEPVWHKNLACVEFKATTTDLKMTDYSKDDTPLLDQMDPMHLIMDGPAIRVAKRPAEKKDDQGESQASLGTLSGSESWKRARDPDDAGMITMSSFLCDAALIERCGPSMLVSAAHEVLGPVEETRAEWHQTTKVSRSAKRVAVEPGPCSEGEPQGWYTPGKRLGLDLKPEPLMRRTLNPRRGPEFCGLVPMRRRCCRSLESSCRILSSLVRAYVLVQGPFSDADGNR